jgi:hypothetical protein
VQAPSGTLTPEETELRERRQARSDARREARRSARLGDATPEDVWSHALPELEVYRADLSIWKDKRGNWLSQDAARQLVAKRMPDSSGDDVEAFLKQRLGDCLDRLGEYPESDPDTVRERRESLPIRLIQRMVKNLTSIVDGVTVKTKVQAGMYASRKDMIQSDSNETSVVPSHQYSLGVLAYALASGALGDVPQFYDDFGDEFGFAGQSAVEKEQEFFLACRALAYNPDNRPPMVIAARNWDAALGFEDEFGRYLPILDGGDA